MYADEHGGGLGTADGLSKSQGLGSRGWQGGEYLRGIRKKGHQLGAVYRIMKV